MRRWLIGLEIFTAVTALVGGALFIAQPDGSLLGADQALLAGTPFGDWLGPGILLAVLVGGGFLAVAAWQWRDGWMARWLSIAAGVGLILFEVVEFAMIGFHPLQAVYSIIGAVIVVLAARLPARGRD